MSLSVIVPVAVFRAQLLPVGSGVVNAFGNAKTRVTRERLRVLGKVVIKGMDREAVPCAHLRRSCTVPSQSTDEVTQVTHHDDGVGVGVGTRLIVA